MDDAFLAVDWGTTNRRIYLIENGAVVRTERDERGVTAVTDFAGEAAAIRARFGDLPMLLAGMVGSNIGWRVAPYVPAPAGVSDLAATLLRIDDRTMIVPGVSTSTDVMRGEEVQLLGAVTAGLVPGDALLVQPGTHCKWAVMVEGRIADFTTAMTGELFALLGAHGLLAAQLHGEVTTSPAFFEGVVDGKRRDLAASLFGIRAAKMLGTRDDADAAAYASGLLIGSDVAARLAAAPDAPIFILSGPELGNLYTAAIAANGRSAALIDSHAAFVAGILDVGAAIA
ncbi:MULTISPECIES: 2-dehydro-3-deoxygalactonokinase [unclassified Sphingomonas]|uniref:2-dehydro-3-deoxygalactonokinase n=1 Tax=unclassified Sphingomonas TaxID=196159 RepID=UPI002150C8E5|nr:MULTISPECIES: 2-dehydro-3-deoxygalactonokinase [unclassified Sphingomonas]MCR5869384.1 2-dehydro-3-deoxygalactonokinase [Sphingomonas sp. J344]UUX98883.1 2-dehydro-3-deoxygalactonokinase [Sphingomonas sp. J315]